MKATVGTKCAVCGEEAKPVAYHRPSKQRLYECPKCHEKFTTQVLPPKK